MFEPALGHIQSGIGIFTTARHAIRHHPQETSLACSPFDFRAQHLQLAACKQVPQEFVVTTMRRLNVEMNKHLQGDQLTPVKAINVKYIYSACVVTTTPDLKVLHDPWFSQGIYDGSWFQFPRVTNPLESIGDVDFIYVSHIHPDHYDSKFLKTYFDRYGTKKIVIADHKPNHLAAKMRADGIVPTIVEGELSIGDTTLKIIPHKTGSISDIDSAIIIKFNTKDKTHCVVNVNDTIFDADMRNMVKQKAGDIDILLCGYTGAGPFPQTYFELDDPQLIAEANKKKLAFFDRYKLLTQTLQAKVNLPFAGKYILGGALAPLNRFRGVADAVEVLNFDPNAIVLADNGGEINTQTFSPTALRTSLYDETDTAEVIQNLASMKMDYERLIASEEIHQLPLRRLLASAAKNAVSKSECEEDYFFCIKLPTSVFAVLNANKNSKPTVEYVSDKALLLSPRSEIYIDARYLFGLLTNIYHWNNAEIGSQYQTRRFPNTHNRKVQAFLNYLAVH